MQKVAIGIALTLILFTLTACAPNPQESAEIQGATTNEKAYDQRRDKYNWGLFGVLLSAPIYIKSDEYEREDNTNYSNLGRHPADRFDFRGGGVDRGGLEPYILGAQQRAKRNEGYTNQPNNKQYMVEIQKIERRVQSLPEVGNAIAVLYSNNLLIGIDTPHSDASGTAYKIRKMFKGEARDNLIYITNDLNFFSRMGEIDRQLQSGQSMDEVASDIRILINDLGRVIIPYTL